jgi:hypothetical protein
MDTTIHNDRTSWPALRALDAGELQQVEGGEVTTAAIAGAIALGGLGVVAAVGVGILLGWGLYELTR